MTFRNRPDTNTAISLLKKIAKLDLAARPKKVDKPLVLYGAGELGYMAKEYFTKIGIAIEYVIDIRADYWRRDKKWDNTKILFPHDIPIKQKKTHLLAVCIATIPFTPLSDNLYEEGWNHVVPFYDIAEAYCKLHPLSNGWFAKRFDTIDIAKISEVLKLWGDSTSRAHHLQFIAWRLLRKEWIFQNAEVNNQNRFFIPEIIKALSDNDYFADVGAHHGNVTSRFIEIKDKNFEMIYMIEPDTINLNVIKSNMINVRNEIKNKIEILPYAVGNKKEKKQFYEGLGYVSQLSDIGNRKVEVTTIDDMKISPSYMKLHLEGGELNALKGAKDTISSYRPIIAVTSYHNDDGIYKLPYWIMKNLNEYSCIMRLHSWCGTGSVIYAFPNSLKTAH